MIVFRKVRNGRVKIRGKWYYPQKKWKPYDGRLDGERWVFGIYKNEPSFVSLWGSEEMFRAKTEEENQKAWGNNKSCINGAFVWAWWRT